MGKGMETSDHVLQLIELGFGYPETVVYRGLNLQISKGTITVLMGPSGCGKSTLLRLMTGQLQAQTGTVLFDGVPLSGLPRKELYRLRRRVGMMFQDTALLSDLNVFENVAFPIRENTQLSESLVRNLVLMKLQMVGLRGAAHLMPDMLSGGMARRVGLARALALDPHVVFYDEPFTGLDPIAKGVIAKLIKELNSVFEATSIVVTQDMNEGLAIADQVVIFSEGRIVEYGTPEKVLRSKQLEARQFLDADPIGSVPFHYPAPDYYEELVGFHR